MKHEFDCVRCGQHKTHESDTTTGYALDSRTGDKTCFDCCADVDREYMTEHGRIDLYLSRDTGPFGTWHVSNWPGTLKFPVRNNVVVKGCHNIARNRYDVWFVGPDKHIWHGTQYGDNTQIVHCRKTREIQKIVSKTKPGASNT